MDGRSGQRRGRITSAAFLCRGTNCGNVASAKEIGKEIAQRAQEKGIKKVVFDRGGYLYHGRIKALADAAREAGLEL